MSSNIAFNKSVVSEASNAFITSTSAKRAEESSLLASVLDAGISSPNDPSLSVYIRRQLEIQEMQWHIEDLWNTVSFLTGLIALNNEYAANAYHEVCPAWKSNIEIWMDESSFAEENLSFPIYLTVEQSLDTMTYNPEQQRRLTAAHLHEELNSADSESRWGVARRAKQRVAHLMEVHAWEQEQNKLMDDDEFEMFVSCWGCETLMEFYGYEYWASE